MLRNPSLRDLAAVFFRHKRLLAISFVAVALAGVTYALLTASYDASMKFVVRRGRIDPAMSPTQTAAPLLQSDSVTEEEMNSEVELFRDQDVLREVVVKNGLADRRPWISWLRRDTPEQKIEHAVNRLARSLEVQPVRKSQVINVAYRSQDPRLAATVLKSVAEIYLAHQVHTQRPAGQQAFFDNQVNVAHGELLSAQHEFEHFTRTRRVVSAALERDLTLQKLSEAQANEFGLEASVIEASSRSQSLDAELRTLPPRRVSQVRNSDNPSCRKN